MITQGFLNGDLLDDKYRIERLLGHGGMGAVYRATHLGTKRAVAVKVIHPQFSNFEEFVARFRREAEAAGRLRHPNVVDVTDFGFAQTSVGQVAYLVMEYLDGCTLAEVLEEERRLPPAWVVDILEQVCSAVDEAHCMGIIHRDLKPDNIWLEPNRRGGYTVKVLDFGLVKLGDAEQPTIEDIPALQAGANQSGATVSPALAESPTLLQTPVTEEAATLLKKPADQRELQAAGAKESPAIAPPASASDGQTGRRSNPITSTKAALETVAADELTRVGAVMGTPLYMSPEQWGGEGLDPRSDIYSLGVVAYRMLTGETPFTGNVAELMTLHKTGEPPPIREKNTKVPKRMARVVMSALAKDPAQRPDSAAGFASALRASIEGSGTLLRHAVSLYSEHLPAFLKISLLAYVPLIVILALLRLPSWETLPPEWLKVIAIPLFLGMVVANLLAYFTISALTVPIVIQLMIAPLRQVSIRTAFAALRRRWWAFTATSLVVLTMILLGAGLLVLPGAVAAVCYALYAPVVVMENLGVRATLKRARRLMQRSWSTVLIITILQFTFPILVWVASVDSSLTFKLADDYSPKEFGFNFSISGDSVFYQLLDIFVTPLTAIMTSLLYLKTRQAGGESLKDAAERFEALEIPRSRWQARMRSRAASSTPDAQSQGSEK
ncbi:MAG TPA: serine/threonine-protein kinase [Blastocatellia bacterium]|nr:serine/threonine-protein kinase [Blastocatellia bacterium]